MCWDCVDISFACMCLKRAWTSRHLQASFKPWHRLPKADSWSFLEASLRPIQNSAHAVKNCSRTQVPSFSQDDGYNFLLRIFSFPVRLWALLLHCWLSSWIRGSGGKVCSFCGLENRIATSFQLFLVQAKEAWRNLELHENRLNGAPWVQAPFKLQDTFKLVQELFNEKLPDFGRNPLGTYRSLNEFK
jgi:hypothetical protein